MRRRIRLFPYLFTVRARVSSVFSGQYEASVWPSIFEGENSIIVRNRMSNYEPPSRGWLFQNFIIYGIKHEDPCGAEKSIFSSPTFLTYYRIACVHLFFYAKRHLSAVRILKRVSKVSALCEDESAFSRIFLPCAHAFRPFQDSMSRSYQLTIPLRGEFDYR